MEGELHKRLGPDDEKTLLLIESLKKRAEPITKYQGLTFTSYAAMIGLLEEQYGNVSECYKEAYKSLQRFKWTDDYSSIRAYMDILKLFNQLQLASGSKYGDAPEFVTMILNALPSRLQQEFSREMRRSGLAKDQI